MKRLRHLIRLYEQKLETQQQRLRYLQNQLQIYSKERQDIGYHLQHEQKIAAQSIEGTCTYATYVPQVQKRLDQLAQLSQDFEAQYGQAQQQLQEIFGELKALETYHHQQVKKTQYQQACRDQQFVDDFYSCYKKIYER